MTGVAVAVGVVPLPDRVAQVREVAGDPRELVESFRGRQLRIQGAGRIQVHGVHGWSFERLARGAAEALPRFKRLF